MKPTATRVGLKSLPSVTLKDKDFVFLTYSSARTFLYLSQDKMVMSHLLNPKYCEHDSLDRTLAASLSAMPY